MDLPPDSPLSGRRILVTRAAGQAARTADLIRSRGGEAVLFPCLEIRCLPETVRGATAAIAEHGTDIAFTSANGVHCVAESLPPAERERLGAHRMAAVGDRTAAAMAEHGWHAGIVAATASQDGLIEAYRDHGLPGRLLLFRAEEGRDALPDWLRTQGVDVRVVHAYRTVCAGGDASAVVAELQADRIDAVLLGSPKTAACYLARIGDTALAARPVLVAISADVASAAEELGLGVQVVASSASFSSMLDALARHYQTSTE